MGAETRQAKAEERVAPKIPAVIKGAKPDTMLMVYREKQPRTGHIARCTMCIEMHVPHAFLSIEVRTSSLMRKGNAWFPSQ